MRNGLSILILIATTGVAAAANPTVRLRPSAVVADAAVRLADVAGVSGMSASVGDVIIAEVASAGAIIEISLAEVVDAMRAAGVRTVPISFCGAASCRIYRTEAAKTSAVEVAVAAEQPQAVSATEATTTQTTGETLDTQIRRQLCQQLGCEAGSLDLQYTQQTDRRAAESPAGSVALTSSDRNELGRRRWRVDETRDGRQYRYYITATVAVRRPMVVATRAILRGERLTGADLAVEVRPDSGEQTYLTDAAQAIGQLADRAIAAGAVIDPSELDAPLLVRRGQSVRVRCGAVSLSATAQSDGALGETIRLTNPYTRQPLRAVVSGPAAARVSLAGGVQ